MKKRNLSGIFIFEKSEDDEKRQPTCFEDCSEATQEKFMNSLEMDGLKEMCRMLAKTLREVGDQFDIARDYE